MPSSQKRPEMWLSCSFWAAIDPSHDRPYKLYIFLKLRAFYIHFKKENNKIGTWTNVVGFGMGNVGNPDSKGGIEIQLTQYLRHM